MRLNERSSFENNKRQEARYETWNLFVMIQDKATEGKVRMFERKSKICGRRKSLRAVKVVQRMTLFILQMNQMKVLKKCPNQRS